MGKVMKADKTGLALKDDGYIRPMRCTPHFLLMLALASVLSSCGGGGLTVQTGTSDIRTLYARVTESGSIQPTVEVPVAPDVSGEVVALAIKEGDQVVKGDLLLTIRPDDYKAQLEQAQASVSQAQAAYQQAQANRAQAKATVLQDSVSLVRTRQLFEEKVVSQVDLENAQLKFEVSRAQMEASTFSVRAAYYQLQSSEATRKQARQSLDRTNIYAAMDGTITQLGIELGQRVVGTSMMAGTDLLKIADLSRMEVVVEINENDIVNVHRGDSTRVEVDAYPDRVFYGRVSDIAYSATTAGMGSTDQVTNFEVKIAISPASYRDLIGGDQPQLPNESPFRPGMTALVEVYTAQVSDVVAVPIQAVTLRSLESDSSQVGQTGQEVVFVYQNGKVRQQVVRVGVRDETYIQVIQGLEADQEIVTGPYTLLSRVLKDGMEVSKEADAAKP
jgi:HlyD family secretion protein